MSNSGWLRGEYKIPTKDWTHLKRNIKAQHQFFILSMMNKAIEFHSQLKAIKPKEREEEFKNLTRCNLSSYYWRDIIFSSLFKDVEGKKKLKKPTKKDFDIINSKTEVLNDDQLQVVFNNKTKTIIFSSDEGNHCQDECLESNLGKVFMKQINKVNWTSKSGGYLKYWDEYHRDEGERWRPMYIKGKYLKGKYAKELCC